MKKHIPIITILAVAAFLIGCTTLHQKDPIETVATEYVKANSVEGLRFKLVQVKKTDSWVVYNVIPLNIETDVAQLYIQNIHGEWKGVAFGTAFPELEEQHPELFQ